MDHETNKQEPSSTEGRQVKVGDKVWVKAIVEFAEPVLVRIAGLCGGGFWSVASDCRPVEPSNSPEIPDSLSEPMREAFEDWMTPKYDWDQSYFGRNENRYFDSSLEMAWKAFQAGVKYQSSPIDNPEPVKQLVIATDNDSNQTLYVDGVLRDGDNTVYGCDVADAANGCAIKIELRDVDFIVDHWPLRLSDLGAEAKQPESSPLVSSPCMDGVDVDQFIDGAMDARGRTSEPMQVGDAVRFVSPGHKRHGTEGMLKSIHHGPKNAYLFVSNCGQFHRYCTIAELQHYDQAETVDIKGSMQSLDGADTIQEGDLQWTDRDGKYRLCNFTIGMRVHDAIERGKAHGEKWVFYRKFREAGE